MHRGYIGLWRKFFEDHEFWKERRVFSKGEAWIDMLANTRHSIEVEKVMIGYKVVECGYGQIIKSNRTWGTRWSWSESKVRRFIKLLTRLSMCVTENVGPTTRITICNFERYDPRRLSNDENVTNWRRRRDADVTTNKNVNNDKNVNSINNNTYLKDIVRHLNTVCGTSFKASTDKTKKCINARIREDFKLQDFLNVIDFKHGEWSEDERMKQYLRPETLFGTKFESYLQAAKAHNKTNDPFAGVETANDIASEYLK